MNNSPQNIDNIEELDPLPGANYLRVSLNFTECRKKFQIKDLQKPERLKLIDTVDKFASLTWHELTQAHRHGLGKEYISRSSIQVGIPEHVRENRFYVIRFDAKKPLIGYYKEGNFMVIWIDRSRKVYKH